MTHSSIGEQLAAQLDNTVIEVEQRILENDLRTVKSNLDLVRRSTTYYVRLSAEDAAKELEHDRQRQAKYSAKQDWIKYVLCVPCNRCLQAFAEVYTLLSDLEYWRLLGHVWRKRQINVEGLENLWRLLFTYPRSGRENFTRPKHRSVYDSLPDEITIYRGHGQHNREGFYYSLNQHVALFFAARAGQDGACVKKMVPKSDCFYIGGVLQEIIYAPEMP